MRYDIPTVHVFVNCMHACIQYQVQYQKSTALNCCYQKWFLVLCISGIIHQWLAWVDWRQPSVLLGLLYPSPVCGRIKSEASLECTKPPPPPWCVFAIWMQPPWWESAMSRAFTWTQSCFRGRYTVLHGLRPQSLGPIVCYNFSPPPSSFNLSFFILTVLLVVFLMFLWAHVTCDRFTVPVLYFWHWMSRVLLLCFRSNQREIRREILRDTSTCVYIVHTHTHIIQIFAV